MADDQPPIPGLEQPKGIDPLPRLGTILNHYERIIFGQMGVLGQLLALVKANNLMNPELEKAVNALNSSLESYLKEKQSWLDEKGPADGKPR